MKKIIPLFGSIMLVLIAGIFATAGTTALFTDTEKISVHDISGGTLDLKVGGGDAVIHVTISNVAPGWSRKFDWTLTNTGSVTGVVKVEFTNIKEIENGKTEPEKIAEKTTFKPAGCSEQKVGLDTGELGYLMRAVPSRAELYPSVEKSPGLPCPNAYMPNGGGLHYLCTRGPFLLGRNYDEAKLAPGESCIFRLRLELADNIKSWDGCGWHDIDDNIIQSDIVEFDIIITLEQVSPYSDETTETIEPEG